MKSFLLIGQSNMAGRGIIGEVPPIANDKIFTLVNGRFQKMWEPVVVDREFSGIGLSASFAEEYVKCYGEDAGLIPCADGGTSLAEWQPGGLLFDNAVNCASLARRSSEIAGVLWHQGENDCAEEPCKVYAEKLFEMVSGLYKSLSLGNIPFIAGELAALPYGNNPLVKEYYGRINEQLREFESMDERFCLVGAEGLTGNADMLHYDAKSQREFGVRYFNAYKKFMDTNILK